MPIRLRKKWRLGPRWLNLNVNATQKGLTSWGTQLGPLSWNSRRRTKRLDLPGPFHWESKRKPKTVRGGRGTRSTTKAPTNLLPLANWCTVAASACTVAATLFGAPLWVAAGGVAFGAGGVGLVVKHFRQKHAQGQQVSQLWRPTVAAGHSPNCRAKSASTCRCPGRRKKQAWGP